MSKHQLSNKTTIDYYNRNASSYFEQTVNLDMSSIYPAFLELIPKSGHILDAGCGSGRDTKHFLDLGYRVTAIDASEEMVKLSSEFTGQSTLHMSFQELSFQDSFDGIWACASLLHISSADIEDIFSKLIDLLKSEGILYISLKKGDGEKLIKDCFYRFYTEDLIQGFFEKFESVKVIKVWSTLGKRKPQLAQEWLNIVARKY